MLDISVVLEAPPTEGVAGPVSSGIVLFVGSLISSSFFALIYLNVEMTS